MPHTSPHGSIEIPDVDLWSFLFSRPSLPYPPSKILYHSTSSPNRRYTYASLRSTSIAFGQALLHSFAWRKGDVLAIFSLNDVDYPAVAYGCLWAGGVITTTNPAYTKDELVGQLKDSGARAIVTQAALLNTAIAAAREAGIPKERVILMGEDRHEGSKMFTELEGREVERPYVINPDKDLAILVYSSGTTGKPKGVMLSQRNIVANVLQIEAANDGYLSCGDGRPGSGDRTVGFLPMYHILGLTSLLSSCTYAGYDVFVMPQFDLEKFCSVVQKERITFNYVVPRIVLALAKSPAVTKYDLSSLRMIISAAAPLTKELVLELHARLGIPVKQSFGMSETSPGTHAQEWDAWDKPIGSIGLPVPGLEAKIVRLEDAREAAPGEVGEMWVRGPNVFKGYLNNPTATQASLTPDGWYKGGDIGYVDENGCFFITDRIKELIKYNGFQVAPAELEGLLVSHPKVKDVAVIGVFSKEMQTELPRAYIVVDVDVKQDRQTADAIISWLNSRVAKHKRLRGGVRFVETIPASGAGKILRRELRVMAEKEEASVKNPKSRL